MKASGLIAVSLSITLPGSAFAQTYAASRAGVSAEAGVTGAIGTIQTAPALTGVVPSPTLSPSALTPSLTPAPNGLLAPSIAPVAALSAVPAAPIAAVAASAAEPAKPAALASALQPAAAKGDAAPTWTEKLAAMFDGGAAKKAEEPELDPANLRAFVVRHGMPMIEVSLEEAARRRGPVRLLTAAKDPQRLEEKHAEKIGELLGAKVQKESILVDWAKKPEAAHEAAKAQSAKPSTLSDKLLRPFREAKFLAKSFRASLVKPLASEVLGGVATKTFPLVTSIGVYWAAVGLAHPWALGGLIALSLTQEIFHGIFLKSWNNFQEVLVRERGFNYQMFFNLAYMQGFGTIYRLLSWSANPKSVTPPWSVHYWKDMAVMSVAGTFFGVMGYNSLNQLYNKGAIKRWQHSGIQQLRDLLFLLAGPFFASGSMTVFWSIFIFQQSLDLAIAIWAGRTQPREIVFVTSKAVADSLEFQKKYPMAGVTVESPVRQAVKAVWENPLVRLITWPVRKAWSLARGGKK